jgi:hypothetical protein
LQIKAAPPPPPPAGRAPPSILPPPALSKPFPIEVDVPSRREPRMALAGFQGGVFLRDPSDNIRIYVQGRLHLDFHSFFGAGTRALPAEDGGVLLSPRLFARRARVGLGGELFQRWYSLFELDFGGQPLTNPRGLEGAIEPTQPGYAPSALSGRYAPIQGIAASPVIANAYIDYTVLSQLHLMLGQIQAPFSMENRTDSNSHAWMERNLPIRSFVVPNQKEIGLMLWGDALAAKNLSYEIGVYLGDGPNRPQVDGCPDFIGRIFARPLASAEGQGRLEKLQIGLSAHHGARDPRYVGYDYPGITTGQGFMLWDPRYRDAQGRLVRVLPSGSQRRFGGELRLPIDRYELRGEAYYVANDTREALDGFTFTHTERLGRVQGLGWYVQLSAWPLGDAFVSGEPGQWRPRRLDLTKKPDDDKRGLEVVAIAGGVSASYDGASRGGAYDARTPGSPAGAASAITVVQLGLGANYWQSRYIRATVNYIAYCAPGGAGENLAVVPGDLVRGAAPASWVHELGTRLGVSF